MQNLMQSALALQQQGRLPEAAGIYRQILRTDPRNFGALYFLAGIHMHDSQFEDAQRLYAEAANVHPDTSDPWFNRGCALVRLEKRDEALACFDRAIAVQPGHIQALVNRAVVLIELGRYAEALRSCDDALALKSDFIPALTARGNALVMLARHEEALAAFDRVLTLRPGMKEAEHNRVNVLYAMNSVTRAPTEYMRELFDSHAAKYDSSMLESLSYRAHLNLRELAGRLLPGARGLRVLDLGCGTGLAGLAFKDLAEGGRLEGIDIAPRMIEKARQHGIYDMLAVGDIVTVLAAPGQNYDLIVSADVVVYIGDLEQLLSGVTFRLVPGGFFLFTVERFDGDGDWDLPATRRFRHNASYIRAAAARAGLSVADIAECTLRTEDREPVAGYAVALRKDAA